MSGAPDRAFTVNLLSLNAPCEACGRPSYTHGSEAVGRRSSGPPLHVVFPLCPSCLYGEDFKAIEAAEARVLARYDAASILPSFAEVA